MPRVFALAVFGERRRRFEQLTFGASSRVELRDSERRRGVRSPIETCELDVGDVDDLERRISSLAQQLE